MMDKIRQKIVSKFCHRAEIASKMEGVILPSVIKDLNKQSKGLKKHKVSRVTLTTAEVTVPDSQGMELRNRSSATPEVGSGQGSNDPSTTVQMPPKKAPKLPQPKYWN
ncbi:hypothetical protein E2562_020310 [Oryza meyeriana var. granulata]|uniref:Uncharacterized protein n=1 Tax=Oryza meyeriana var. granulata TaxID=110450 RepID=A0A6G1EB84_9ORYZ|nr:hypothetical protein E2562_020310 [Oryza meyeriana var. granulata]